MLVVTDVINVMAAYQPVVQVCCFNIPMILQLCASVWSNKIVSVFELLFIQRVVVSSPQTTKSS